MSPIIRAIPVVARLVTRAAVPTSRYGWIVAISTIAFTFSAFGNGANDVANAYATAVSARTLTMPQAGILAMFTEFTGAVALGARVTDTIKNGIIGVDTFRPEPGTLMLAMTCAEVGSASWLMFATHLGFPVSTTQTIVGAIIGSGIASGASVGWAWRSGSVSQIAASWLISPLISAAMSAAVFGVIKFGVLERKESLKWAMRLMPAFLAFTAAILALFIVIEAPTAPSLEEFGVGKSVGIILGVFFGMLVIAYIFFMPYFQRRVIREDARVKPWHIPMGPLLLREDVKLYWPADPTKGFVTDYYDHSGDNDVQQPDKPDEVLKTKTVPGNDLPPQAGSGDTTLEVTSAPTVAAKPAAADTDCEKGSTTPGASDTEASVGEVAATAEPPRVRRRRPTPREHWIDPYKKLPLVHPLRLAGYAKYALLQGVAREVAVHDSKEMREMHARAARYDVRVEHLFTYCQVASAMLLSLSHGSNDVANAVGPWSATYETFLQNRVATEADTPIFILVVAGFLLGLGFWVYGWKIMSALGNKITQISPTRGFSIELGASITVMMASRLGLPVSTTQCLVGASMGVALMNFDTRAVNWKQLGYIFIGWCLTLPCAGLISGLLCAIMLNAPKFPS